jgi:hypothetical protein
VTSLVSRSLAELRKRAPHCPVDKAERWIPGANIRRDLFNLFDLVWLSLSMDSQDGQIVGIQVTDNAHLAEHITKIKANPITKQWVACGGGITVHAWAKMGARGKRKRWTLTEHDL